MHFATGVQPEQDRLTAFVSSFVAMSAHSSGEHSFQEPELHMEDTPEQRYNKGYQPSTTTPTSTTTTTSPATPNTTTPRRTPPRNRGSRNEEHTDDSADYPTASKDECSRGHQDHHGEV